MCVEERGSLFVRKKGERLSNPVCGGRERIPTTFSVSTKLVEKETGFPSSQEDNNFGIM